MRIGIDGSCWANRRGFGRFTRCLVEEMARRADGDSYVLLLDAISAADPQLDPPPPGVEVASATLGAAPVRAAGAASSRSVRDMLRMTAAARRLGCDVFFFPATYSYFPVVGAPVVVVVHDAIAEQLPQLTLLTRSDRVRWRLKQAAALRQARAVITVSNASRRAVVDVLHVAPERLHVIREAPAPHFRPLPEQERAPLLARFGLAAGDPYLLYVGGISPHKNLETLVAAFCHVAERHSRVRLLLVGDTDEDPFLSSTTSIRAAVAAAPVADRITLTGFVGDAELVALYSGAVATALPSLGEGFGLTAAESAACGTPVVASRDPALVELLGEAGVYAEARSPDDLARQLYRLLDDPAHRRERSAAVTSRARTWSWGAAAETTLAVLHEAAHGHG